MVIASNQVRLPLWHTARNGSRLSTVACTLLLSSALALCGFINNAEAQCDPRVFLVQEIKDIRATGETELAFVLTATQEEFDAAKRSGALSGAYGLISGSSSFSEAKEKAVRIAQATKFDYHTSYASSYFSQTYSAKALAAYESCLNHRSAGLPIWLASRDGDYFTFQAFWVGRNLDDAKAKYDAPPIVDGGAIISMDSRKNRTNSCKTDRQQRYFSWA